MPSGSASWSHSLTCLHAPQLRRWERSLTKGWESQSWDSTAFPSQLPCSLLALFSISSLSTCALQELPFSIKLNPLFPDSPSPLCPLNPFTHTSLHRSQSWHGILFSCPCFHRTPQGLSVTLSRSPPLPSFRRWWTSRQRSLPALLLPPLTISSLTLKLQRASEPCPFTLELSRALLHPLSRSLYPTEWPELLHLHFQDVLSWEWHLKCKIPLPLRTSKVAPLNHKMTPSRMHQNSF